MRDFLDALRERGLLVVKHRLGALPRRGKMERKQAQRFVLGVDRPMVIDPGVWRAFFGGVVHGLMVKVPKGRNEYRVYVGHVFGVPIFESYRLVDVSYDFPTRLHGVYVPTKWSEQEVTDELRKAGVL